MKKTLMRLIILAFSIALFSNVAKAKLVACVGNSNTYGALLPDRMNNCYPAQLEKLLQQIDPRWETKNFGVNGATVLRQGDIPYVNQGAYHQALASKPDVVIFEFGGNASRSNNRGYIQDSYVSDYISLIDAFIALPSRPKIWICYPLKAFSGNYTISDAIIRDQIIPLITQIASERDLPIIDFYTVFKDLPHLYLSDGLHPNPSGTKLMAEIVVASLFAAQTSPDFDGDGSVTINDLLRLIESWGQDDPVIDIAPPPFGDGIVDALDLEVLMSYWGQPVDDPTLLAHWALDETEGMVVTDSAGDNNGYALGDPVWQPDSGHVDGVLKFDGADDYVITGFIPKPAEWPFSVLAWVKGGAPGQAVLSQMGVANWLCTDPSEGNLITELANPSRDSSPLRSQTVITDGTWHRIGFVWDGSHRTLHIDSVVVAEDAQDSLEISSNGLYIGTGKIMELGSFWSGLIDDIRIYNRAVSP